MLSRVAERLYWLTRYLERAEDTARLTNAYSQLILDLPRGLEPGWGVLIETLEAGSAFGSRFANSNERNVVKFLLTDAENSASILHCISAARENMRTTRDVMPAQAWELMNEFYMYVESSGRDAVARQSRFDFLEEVISRAQQIHGLIESTVLRSAGLWFMRLGRALERADMTSRILDVGTAAIGQRGEKAEIPLLWANLLKSLSATSAYRRIIGPELARGAVVDFVFRNTAFPRSIAYCLSSAQSQLTMLSAPEAMQRDLTQTLRSVMEFEAETASPEDMHVFIDDLQGGVAQLHEELCEAWFAPPPAE